MVTPPTAGREEEATGRSSSSRSSAAGSVSGDADAAATATAAKASEAAVEATGNGAPSTRRREIFDPHSKFKQIRR